MRLSLWLLLILAFSVGMGCALSIRYYYFDAVPVAEKSIESTTKILFSKRTIPGGMEITADYVVFQDVPLSEVPTRALTSFSQVYRRQPAGSIPAGYPICDDLLLPLATSAPRTAFVPAGNQIVALDVVHIRQEDKIVSPQEPLSTLLSAGQSVDIRTVPFEAQGRLAEKKNELLRTFGQQDFRNSGELVLENVPIYQIQRQINPNRSGLTRDSLELMLDKSESARLTAAAKKGQIRILVHQDERVSERLSTTDTVDETSLGIADASVPSPKTTLPGTLSLEQSVSLDIPHVQHSFLPVSPVLDSVVAVPAEQVQRAAPTPMESPSAQVGTMLPLLKAEEITQNTDQQPDRQADANVPELPIKEINDIRNDGMVAFGALPFRHAVSEPPPVREPTSEAVRFPELDDATEAETFVSSPALHSPSELTLGIPRVANTIQFLPLGGGIAPMREYPHAMSLNMEPIPIPTVMPSAMPGTFATQGRLPEYTPFERRIYTVLPADNLGKGSSEAIPVPQRLIRSSDSGTQTK